MVQTSLLEVSMPEATLLPGYLIVGLDEVKRDTAVARLRKRLEASGMADFNFEGHDEGAGSR